MLYVFISFIHKIINNKWFKGPFYAVYRPQVSDLFILNYNDLNERPNERVHFFKERERLPFSSVLSEHCSLLLSMS